MLTRQLASAGSGKTYTLAKQFILLFITVPDERTGRRRLRTRAELTDSLRHILAITFTNKATGEMKQRIISKLAALASYKPLQPLNGTAPSEEEIKLDKDRRAKIDYLDEFCETLSVEPGDVAAVAKEALDVLLNEFSDFQVSTIDSFFQQVMRTFTYEAELPDNFQLEMDSKYVAGLGLDTALTELNTSRASETFRYWARKMVEAGVNDSGSWNLFAPGKRTLYTKVLSMITTMESESFKESMEELRKYFEEVEERGVPQHGGFIGELITHYDNKYSLPLRREATAVRRAATEALDYMTRNGIEPEELTRYLYGRLVKLTNLNWQSGPDGNYDQQAFLKETAMKKGIADDPGFLDKVHAVGHALADYLDRLNDPDLKSWLVYSKALRRFALTWEIKKTIDSLMVDSNTLQLSDTNSILNTIIGDDETPFIYERLGSKLDHFLIDEFQDTSRLQWENTLPLLRESEGRGMENLIIGDPKQSIYRFRNADSSLITTAVRKEFPNLHDAGADPKTNTNWRSALNIVRFNNFLFHSLAAMGMDYTDSYGDVIQFSNKYKASKPEHTRAEGFVSLKFFKADDVTLTEPESAEDSETDFPEFFSEIGPLITELRGRGFRQKDIAVLVNTHRVGSQVINSLLDYNSRIDPDAPDAPEPIRFVSEDSLKVANARGVRIVIEALKALNGETPFTRPAVRGCRDLTEEEEETTERQEPMAQYSVYAHNNRAYVSDELAGMLAGMAVTTLPALIEELIATFVPRHVRTKEAPFLAALQDTVLEFTETHIADIPTFIKWWDKHGGALTISSPESTDAVQIVTVHSAKGLEFGAVIIPDVNYSFNASPMKVETAWLEPKLHIDEDYPLPPVLPIELTGALEETYHNPDLSQYRRDVATDKLNAAYVAFTRAKYELHVLEQLSKTNWPEDPLQKEEKPAKKSKSKDLEDLPAKVPAISNLAKGIFNTFLEPEKWLETVPSEKMPYVIDSEALSYAFTDTVSADGRRIRKTLEIRYGEPVDLRSQPSEATSPEPENAAAETAEEAKAEESVTETSGEIKTYSVSDAFPALHFRSEEALMDSPDAGDDGFRDETPGEEVTGHDELPEEEKEILEEEQIDEQDVTPFSELELVRATLGRLAVTPDLDRALLPQRISGKWTDTQIGYVRDLIDRFIKSGNGRQFVLPPEGWKVYANRPLIHKRRKTRIPDRVHISPAGDHAMVINFKHEGEPAPGDMIRLRAHVRALRKTGFKGSIEGWLCLLQTGAILPLRGRERPHDGK